MFHVSPKRSITHGHERTSLLKVTFSVGPSPPSMTASITAVSGMNEENLYLSPPGQSVVEESGSQLNPPLTPPVFFSFSSGVAGDPKTAPGRQTLPKICLAREGCSENKATAVNMLFFYARARDQLGTNVSLFSSAASRFCSPARR